MTNIIPLAGLGSRFNKEGYKLPKPLISVSGIPMIIKAIKNMPKSNKWIFIVRKEHIENYKIEDIIKKEISDAIIIPVDKTTEGQACTCMLAEPYLNPDEPLFITACDNISIYNKEKHNELVKNPQIDSVFWTFTKREILKQNPNAYGWYRLEEDNQTIKDVSIKIPVSNNPYNDHAVTASFYFKKSKYFIDSTNLMIKENYKINNEFYIDSLPRFLKKLDKKSVIFDVDFFISWDTPENLHEYEKMEFLIKNNIATNFSDEEKKLLHLWNKHFKSP